MLLIGISTVALLGVGFLSMRHRNMKRLNDYEGLETTPALVGLVFGAWVLVGLLGSVAILEHNSMNEDGVLVLNHVEREIHPSEGGTTVVWTYSVRDRWILPFDLKKLTLIEHR